MSILSFLVNLVSLYLFHGIKRHDPEHDHAHGDAAQNCCHSHISEQLHTNESKCDVRQAAHLEVCSSKISSQSAWTYNYKTRVLNCKTISTAKAA